MPQRFEPQDIVHQTIGLTDKMVDADGGRTPFSLATKVPVRRIDQAYGDRNLMCSCPPVEAFRSLASDLVAATFVDGSLVYRDGSG